MDKKDKALEQVFREEVEILMSRINRFEDAGPKEKRNALIEYFWDAKKEERVMDLRKQKQELEEFFAHKKNRDPYENELRALSKADDALRNYLNYDVIMHMTDDQLERAYIARKYVLGRSIMFMGDSEQMRLSELEERERARISAAYTEAISKAFSDLIPQERLRELALVHDQVEEALIHAGRIKRVTSGEAISFGPSDKIDVEQTVQDVKKRVEEAVRALLKEDVKRAMRESEEDNTKNPRKN